MKQQELKPLIIQQWDQWVQTQSIKPGHASARDSFKFYLELQDERLSCTRFRRHQVRCFMEQEVGHGETEVHARVQA
jgi:hypothetical protein